MAPCRFGLTSHRRHPILQYRLAGYRHGDEARDQRPDAGQEFEFRVVAMNKLAKAKGLENTVCGAKQEKH